MTTATVGKLTQAQLLMALADLAEVFRVQDGDTAYATVDVQGHRETWPRVSTGSLRVKGG